MLSFVEGDGSMLMTEGGELKPIPIGSNHFIFMGVRTYTSETHFWEWQKQILFHNIYQ